MIHPSRLIAAAFVVALLCACSPQSSNGASAQSANASAPLAETGPGPSPAASATPGHAGGAFSAMLQTCSADFQKFCPDAKPGSGAIAACIKQYRDSFSEPCKSAVPGTRSRPGGAFSAMRQACSADFQQFCPDAKPGGGAIAACIKQHRDSFSDPCKSAIPRMRSQPQQNAGSGAGPGGGL